MEPIIERCAGVDVGQAVVVVCILVGEGHKKPRKEVRTFRTLTKELLEMRDWFLSEGITHVGMESTGVYWKPVYAVLEDHFEVIVGNAHHIKNVPGRKTDVRDAEWLADLVRHGLIAKSFVPPPPIRVLRDLLRYRRKLVESRTSERNRLLKLLETANIKLSSVASDVFGVSGMLMLKALLEGTSTPQEIARLAKGRLREKIADLELALEGRMDFDHRFLLGLQLQRLEQAETDIAKVDERIEERLKPYEEQHTRLKQIPGVDHVIAAILIAELGVDMTVFHSADHLAAWAGMCPGNNESAGKRKNTLARKGNIHLKTALYEAARPASQTKGSYFKDKFYRLKARRGYKRAAIAVGHKILNAAYHMLAKGEDYKDLGEAYLDHLDKTKTAGNLVRRLQRLGYEVKIKEVPKVA
jgi:transposase